MKNKKRILKYLTLTTVIFIFSLASYILFKEINEPPDLIEIRLDKDDLHDSLLSDHYYVNLSKRKYIDPAYIFDKDSIPLYQNERNYYYHPVFISQFALGAYEYYLNTKDANAKDSFLKCADWLKDNMKKHGNFSYWEYTFENLGLSGSSEGVPWFSAMAQGEGASVLLRAFSITKKTMYLQAASDAITPIFYDLSSGGVSVVKGDDYIFPQEYPTNPPPNVFNGAVAAYLGVYDYYRVTGDPDIKKKSDTILKTFSNLLEQYDTGYWSLYCLWPSGLLADPHYHSVHIADLRILYLISGDEKFLDYSRRFEGYQESYGSRVRYIFANNLRRMKNVTCGDIKKIPNFLKKYLAF